MCDCKSCFFQIFDLLSAPLSLSLSLCLSVPLSLFFSLLCKCRSLRKGVVAFIIIIIIINIIIINSIILTWSPWGIVHFNRPLPCSWLAACMTAVNIANHARFCVPKLPFENHWKTLLDYRRCTVVTSDLPCLLF